MSEESLDESIEAQEHFKNVYATPWDFKLLSYLNELKQARQDLVLVKAERDALREELRRDREQEPVAIARIIDGEINILGLRPVSDQQYLYASPVPAQKDMASDEMLNVGAESLRRGLDLFGENYHQIASNVWEDMMFTALKTEGKKHD